MTTSETPAVKEERERREEQSKLWDKARQSARDLINNHDNNSWISTADFVKHIHETSEVSRGVAIAVMQELRDNGETVYTLSKGYKKSSIVTSMEEEKVLRPEDIQRRNNFLSFVDAMYRIENS